MEWPDYRVLVEIPVAEHGVNAHLFGGTDWSDKVWPGWYIKGLVDNFIEQHDPPTQQQVALYKVEKCGWRVDALAPGHWKLPEGWVQDDIPRNVILIRVFGPMPEEMYQDACEAAPTGTVPGELDITPVH